MTKAILGNLEFDTSEGQQPDICLARAGMYLIAYEGPDLDLWAATVTISATGAISAVLDSLELDTVNTSNCQPRVIQLATGYAAVVYKGDDSDGYLMTVSIAADGTIAIVDTWEHTSGTVWDQFIINISGTVYAIASYGAGLFTVDISAAGVITKAKIDTLSLSVSSNRGVHIIHISGDIWAIAYSSKATGEDGVIDTIEIDSSGNIGAAVIDTFNVTTGRTFHWLQLLHIAGTIYACIYYDATSTDTELFTIDIQNDGTIAAAVTDSEKVSTSGFLTSNIGLWDTNDYLVTRPGNAVNVAIADDGTIGAITDSLSTGTSSWVRQIATAASKVWAIVYQGGGNDGFISTIGVTKGYSQAQIIG